MRRRAIALAALRRDLTARRGKRARRRPLARPAWTFVTPRAQQFTFASPRPADGPSAKLRDGRFRAKAASGDAAHKLFPPSHGGAAKSKRSGAIMVVRVGAKYQRLVAGETCPCCDPGLREFTLRMNADLSRRGFWIGSAAAASLGLPDVAAAASAQPRGVLFENVRIFDGDPIANIALIEDPGRNFAIILTDGRLYKNALRRQRRSVRRRAAAIGVVLRMFAVASEKLLRGLGLHGLIDLFPA